METRLTARALALASLTTCMFATAFSSSASAQSTPIAPQPAGVAVPGYGPGIAGNVSVGPTTPICLPHVPCTRPFVDAHVEIFDNLHQPVASAISNDRGNFLVSVPSGEYIVHIQVVDFPRCPEAQVTVAGKSFSLVDINCDTGIR
jgi:hypothetical protein